MCINKGLYIDGAFVEGMDMPYPIPPNLSTALASSKAKAGSSTKSKRGSAGSGASVGDSGNVEAPDEPGMQYTIGDLGLSKQGNDVEKRMTMSWCLASAYMLAMPLCEYIVHRL